MNTLNVSNKGFTLIELLVVISIIGVFGSVVLASLNSGRNKGADASIKANLSNMRSQAELYFSEQNPNTYVGVCANGTAYSIGRGVQAALDISGSGTLATRCSSNSTGWAAFVPMKTDSSNSWCVDSLGASKLIPTPYSGPISVCP